MGAYELAVIMLLFATQSPAAPAPLQPSGKWSVSYEQDRCILSRDFGTGPDKLTLAITPTVIGSGANIAVITTEQGSLAPDRGMATILLDAEPISRAYNSAASGKDRLRITRTDLYRPEMARLARSAAVTLPVSRGRTITLSASGIAAALKAAGTCVTDLQKTQGLDPVALDQAVGNAIPIDGDSWFSTGEYPMEALRNSIEGDSIITWTVGADGRAHDCRPFGTHGNPILDDQACRIITDKARYLPEKDTSGKAIETRDVRRVRWRLPG